MSRGERLPPAGVAALFALAAAIYGLRVDAGYLADDFLYLSWWREGWGELLRRVTVDSDPRMIRPLPALAWALSALPGGDLLHHGLSVLLHAACGWQVARLAVRLGGTPETGLWAAALFVSFPLFTEPVLWLSAAPDLWACLLALAALDAGLRERRGAAAGAAGLFALALLSKESVLLLPAVAIGVAPGRRARRLALVLGAVAGVYLAGRLALFSGVGGYLDEAGRSAALAVDPLRFLRNLTLQLPYRLLVPLKRAGDLAPCVALITAGLALATVATAGLWKRPEPLARAALALVLALVPVTAFFSIDADHENARLLYFPAALLAAAAGPALGRATPRLRIALGAWVALWSAITIANGRTWSDAGLEVRHTLAAMEAVQARYPAGATVLVDGHDTRRGAYVWRNGLAFAARREGLRDDLHWRLGSAALVPRAELLGRRIFGLGLDADGRPRDLTPCQRRLLGGDLEMLGRAVPEPATPGRFETGPIVLSRATRFPAAVIAARSAGDHGGLEGRLFWRLAETARFDPLRLGAPRFTVTEARRFRIFPGSGGRAVVRLPAAAEPVAALDVRVELADPGADPPAEIQIAEAPEPCRFPARR